MSRFISLYVFLFLKLILAVPDLNLLIKDKKQAVCVGTGDEVEKFGFALVTSNLTNQINYEKLKTYNGRLTQDYEGMKISSFERNIPPVFDKRWKNLDIKRGNNRAIITFDTKNLIIINISVRFNRYLQIQFSFENKDYCANILEGQNTTTTFKNPCQAEYVRNESSFQEWKHYSIFKTKNNFVIQPSIVNNYNEAREVFTLSQIKVRSSKPFQYKIHKYDILEVNTDRAKSVYNNIQIIKSDCLSIFLFINPRCLIHFELYDEKEDERLKKELINTDEEYKWMEVKLFFEQGIYENVLLNIDNTNKCSAYIDKNIYECSNKYIDLVTSNIAEDTDVACQYFQDNSMLQSKEPSTTIQTASPVSFGANNNISCKDVFKTEICEKTLICSQALCYCAPGYKGLSCQNECDDNKWGLSCRNSCKNCEQYSCNKYTGKCAQCKAGYFGDTCAGIMFNLSITNILPTKVDLKIEVVESHSNSFTNITIQYKKSNSAEVKYLTCDLPGLCSLDDLDPLNDYEVCVFYEKTCFKKKQFKTNCLGLNKSNFNLNIGRTNCSIEIIGFVRENCPLRSYKLGVNSINDLKEDQIIEELTPFTNYKLKVKFMFQQDYLSNKESSEFTIDFATKQAEPKRVLRLKYNEGNNSITFDAPQYPNGIIRNYTINVYLLKYRTPICKDEVTNQLLNTYSIENLNFQFEKSLLFYRLIKFEVIPVNDVGPGLPESVDVQFAKSDTMTEEEKPLKISLKSNCINMALPKCNKIYGPLFYNFEYTCLDNTCVNKTKVLHPINVEKSGNKAKISGLTPYSLYKVVLINYCRYENASCLDGDGISATFLTNPDAPPKVENLESFMQNSTSIGLRFEKPFPPHGVLDYFNISYSKDNNSLFTTQTFICNLWKDYKNYHCVIITNLEENFYYNIKVFGMNKNVSKAGAESMITVKTVEKASSPPLNVISEVSEDNDVFLKWEYPKYPNGFLKKFVIRANLTESIHKEYNHDFTMDQAVTDIGQSYEFKINRLKDSSVYHIYISAESSVKGNENGNIIISTYPKKPKLDNEPIANCNYTHCHFDTLELKDLLKENNVCIYKTNKGASVDLKEIEDGNKCLYRAMIDTQKRSQKPTISFKISDSSNETKTNGYEWRMVVYNAFSNKRSYLYKKIIIDSEPQTGGSPLWHLFWLLLLIPPIVLLILWKMNRLKNCRRKDDHARSENIPLFSKEVENEILKDKFGSYINTLIENENCLEKLESEFKKVPPVAALSMSIGKEEENQAKNRFKNIIPYDETRVVLNGIKGKDYINASYVEGHLGMKTFIATQCPKSNTAYDFWRMIWQENISIIVCLAAISEGEDKMYHYWPEKLEDLTVKDITVVHYSDEVYTDYIIRNLHLQRNEKRKLRLINYLTWPDQEIPTNPLSYYYFLRHVQDLDDGLNSILVHCSAGIGRTGTFIMTYNLTKNQNHTIDIPKALKSIRSCRQNLVSKINQYRFIYYILHVHMYEKQEFLTLKEFANKALTVTDTELMEDLNYVKEKQYFNKLLYSYDVHQSFCPEKNRVAAIVPKGPGVIYLPRLGSENKSNYINAVYVNGYEKEHKFISTQHPLPNTVEDFWRLVADKRIKLIISLQNVEEKDKFWPSNKPELSFNFLSVSLERKILKNEIAIYNLKLKNFKTEKTSKIIFISFKPWKCGKLTPENMESLNHLYNLYKTEAQRDENIPVLLVCHDSVTACGLFITLDLVLDKLKNTNQFNIRWAVQTIQISRMEFMNSVEQYRFIYKLIFYHLNLKKDNDAVYENINKETIPYETFLYENLIQ